MKNFILTGLKPPGRINLPHQGTIELEKIDDTLAEKLWRDGLPFIKPKPEYLKKLYPGESTPEPRTLKSTPKTTKAKTGSGKKK
jgi:hypothetical protein